MIWDRSGKNWPLRQHSRFQAQGKLRWHIQEAGPEAFSGKVEAGFPSENATNKSEAILLLHGTGASTHSFRHIIEPLAKTHRVIAVDLPGQGFTFTSDLDQCSLKGMTAAIAALLAELDVAPAIIIGHSAGAAIAYQLALDLPSAPRRVVSINGALESFPGVAGAIMPLSAKLMGFGAIGANLVSLTMSSETAVRKLIEATGSRIDARGLECYRALVADSGHVDATIAMMARWELGPLIARAGEVKADSLLITGGRDRAVDPKTSTRWAKRVRHAEIITLPTSGHLLHEEDSGAPFLAHLNKVLG